MRLLTDENFNGSILRGLMRRLPGLDIVRVQDVGLIHADDPIILEWAANEGRILLTHDVATITVYAYELGFLVMTKAISWVLKILYWSAFWAGGLGWVVLLQGQGQEDMLGRIYKGRLFIPIVCLLGAVGGIGILFDKSYINETFFSDHSKLYFYGGSRWAFFWTLIFIVAIIRSPSVCAYYVQNCDQLGFIAKPIILVLGTPVVALYTAFIGMIGTIIYVGIFGVGGDLRR